MTLYDVKTRVGRREAETIRGLTEAQKITICRVLDRADVKYLVIPLSPQGNNGEVDIIRPDEEFLREVACIVYGVPLA